MEEKESKVDQESIACVVSVSVGWEQRKTEKGIYDVSPARKMGQNYPNPSFFWFSSHFSRGQNTDRSLLTETLATQAKECKGKRDEAKFII